MSYTSIGLWIAIAYAIIVILDKNERYRIINTFGERYLIGGFSLGVLFAIFLWPIMSIALFINYGIKLRNRKEVQNR